MLGIKENDYHKIKSYCIKNSKEKIYNSLYNLYDSIVDVMNDFLKERQIKDTNQDNSKLNPLRNRFTRSKTQKDEEFYYQTFVNIMKFILKLDLQESTIIVAFIYLDRFLKKDDSVMTKESFEK